MNFRLGLLTCFGLGRLPVAPGTFGSLPPVLLALGLISAGAEHLPANMALILLGLLGAVACVRFGSEGEQTFGTKDPSQIVADEVAGQCLALLFLPWGDSDQWRWNIALAVGAFVAFRFFDILKPPPIRALQRVTGGWGILIDDLIAGVYALIVGQLVARVIAS